MGFFILVLTIIVYFIRPAEWIPALYFNWNMLLNGLGILFFMATAISPKNKFNFDRTTFYLFCFFAAMVISNLVNGQAYTISSYFSQMLSTVVIFILIQSAIKTEKNIDNFIFVIILLILFISYQGHLQSTVGMAWGGLEPYTRSLVSGQDAESIKEIQIIWYGILGDPNDLGMLLIAFTPYVFNKMLYQPINFSKKIFWGISLVIIIYAVILTNSRGSMLALIGGLSCFYIIKKRSVAGLVMAIIFGLAILALAPSRMGELTSGDYSAMGRIYAWILALELFAMNPVFGVGAKHFLDFHALTTHNSYVLAFVENGILGFIGFFSIFVLAVYSGVNVALKEENKARSTEIISLVSGLIGILISIFFISRTYVLLPFLYVAILVTYLRIYTPELYAEAIKKLSIQKLIIFSFAFVIFIYLFNRLTTTLLL